MKVTSTTYESVPDEGQPWAWWADLRIIGIVTAVLAGFVRKFGLKWFGLSESEAADVITFLGVTLVPVVFGIIGEVLSRRRRKVVKETIKDQNDIIRTQGDAINTLSAENDQLKK